MWTKADIISLLSDGTPRAEQAIDKTVLAIYNLQTSAEQNAETTVEHNGVGFSGAHGEIGTSMGLLKPKRNFLKPKRNFLKPKRNFLKPKQRAYWAQPMASGRPRITMYAGQLAKIANNQIRAV